MFSYSTGYYVLPPDDQYLKFKNRCSLMGNPMPESTLSPSQGFGFYSKLLISFLSFKFLSFLLYREVYLTQVGTINIYLNGEN
jgi:hypothetical protein